MKTNSLLVVSISLFAVLLSIPNIALSDVMTRITVNVESVCKKPGDAASYWDIKVKGDGSAKLKMLLGTEISGGAEFTRQQWDGVVNTIEETSSYRTCVEKLAPIFIEKFVPVLDSQKEMKTRNKLGGIQWMEFQKGVELTLKKCAKKGKTVVCNLVAIAAIKDENISIYGKSLIYDQGGKFYSLKYATIANVARDIPRAHDGVVSPIVKDVTTEVSLHFPDVGSDATSISKLSIQADISGGVEFVFRNVQIDL